MSTEAEPAAPPSTSRLGARLRGHAPFLVVLLATAVAYLAIAPAHVLGHDNGEYLTVGAEGGVPHPSGYPLYVLWLRLWSWLPGLSPAHRASIATALLGVGCLALLYAACRAWVASRFAAATACSVLALSPRSWILFTHAENLALNGLLAAALLLVAAPRGPVRRKRRMMALGLLAGLGLSNHLSILLLAPVGLGAAGAVLWRARHRGRAALEGLLGLAGGLTPYLYLMQIARHPDGRWVWGDTSTLSGLLGHALRTEYGSMQLVLQDFSASTADQLTVFAWQVGEDLLWAPTLLGLGAAVLTLRGLGGGSERRQLAPSLLLLSLLAAGPGFMALANIPPRGVGLHLLARFYLLAEIILTVFVARGLHQLIGAARRRGVFAHGLPRPLHALPVALIALTALFATPAVREHHRPTVALYLNNTLRSLPDDAIVTGVWDLRVFGFMYLQRIEQVRPDVTHLSPPMLFRPWYRRRIERVLGIELPDPQGVHLDMVALADRLLSTGRPVFLLDHDANHEPILSHFANYPHGTAIRVLPPGAELPSLLELERLNEQLFEHYRLEPTVPNDPTSWSALVYQSYARPWSYLAAEHAERGNRQQAERLRERARAFAVR